MITVPRHTTTVLVSDTFECGPFPTADELLAAIQGDLDTHSELVTWARRLGCLYEASGWHRHMVSVQRT